MDHFDILNSQESQKRGNHSSLLSIFTPKQESTLPGSCSSSLPTSPLLGISPSRWTDLDVGSQEDWSEAGGGVRGAEGKTERTLHLKLKMHISPHFLRTYGHPLLPQETSGEPPIRELSHAYPYSQASPEWTSTSYKRVGSKGDRGVN